MRILLFVIVFGLAMPFTAQAFQANAVRTPTDKFAPKRFEPRPYDYTAKGDVVMYSQTFCGPCKVKRKQLKAAGIPFKEYFIDKDDKRNKEMYRLLDENKMPRSYYGTPMIVVNGEILGNPPVSVIKEKLKQKIDRN